MALDTALNLFQWDRVAMVLFAIFMVVIVAEIAVTHIRKHVIGTARLGGSAAPPRAGGADPGPGGGRQAPAYEPFNIKYLV